MRAARDAPFGVPRPLPAVNTALGETEVFVTPDGCELYFVRATGTRAEEIYSTRYLAR